MTRTVLAIAGAAALFNAGAAHARDYHIAVTGNDNHTGSKTEPLRTIQKAARAIGWIIIEGP